MNALRMLRNTITRQVITSLMDRYIQYRLLDLGIEELGKLILNSNCPFSIASHRLIVIS